VQDFDPACMAIVSFLGMRFVVLAILAILQVACGESCALEDGCVTADATSAPSLLQKSKVESKVQGEDVMEDLALEVEHAEKACTDGGNARGLLWQVADTHVKAAAETAEKAASAAQEQLEADEKAVAAAEEALKADARPKESADRAAVNKSAADMMKAARKAWADAESKESGDKAAEAAS
jgi:hypothetical protein